MKKKLPRAITVSRADMQAAVLDLAGSASSVGPREDPIDPHGAGDWARGAEQPNNVVPIKPGTQDARDARERNTVMHPARPVLDPGSATRRRSAAIAIVHRYARYSALGGIVPIPVANFAGVTAVIVRMVRALSLHYGLAFERDRSRAFVVALVGGAVPTGAAAVTTSALLYVLPPAALLGLAVSSLTAAEYTRSVGRIFVEQFERAGTSGDVSAAEQ
jgi:uncharacterized protein (DUF697 family)